MDKKLENIIQILVAENFAEATTKERKQKLVDLCDYICAQRYIVSYDFGFRKVSRDAIGETNFTSISLDKKFNYDSYFDYIMAFEAVIHECFHLFQYHLMALPEEAVSATTWARLKEYKKFDIYLAITKSVDDSIYRFNYLEWDAYRHTDGFMRAIYKHLKLQGKNVKIIDYYLKLERSEFLHEQRKYHPINNPDAHKNVDSIMAKAVLSYALKNKRVAEKLWRIRAQDCLDVFNNGDFGQRYLDGCDDLEICDLFVSNAEAKFKEALPFLFPSSNHLKSESEPSA